MFFFFHFRRKWRWSGEGKWGRLQDLNIIILNVDEKQTKSVPGGVFATLREVFYQMEMKTIRTPPKWPLSPFHSLFLYCFLSLSLSIILIFSISANFSFPLSLSLSTHSSFTPLFFHFINFSPSSIIFLFYYDHFSNMSFFLSPPPPPPSLSISLLRSLNLPLFLSPSLTVSSSIFLIVSLSLSFI